MRNLGWKLAATLVGWGGEALLDSYSAERQPVFASTADDFIEKSINEDRAFLAAYDPARDRAAFEAKWRERQTGAKSEVGAFEPHYEGSPLLTATGGRSSAVGAHSFVARPGHHLAPQPLSAGGMVTEALGSGFALVALGTDEATLQAFRQAADELHVPLTVIEDSRSGGRERYEAGLVLLRPDQFVAGAWDGPVADPVKVLRRAVGGKLSDRARKIGARRGGG